MKENTTKLAGRITKWLMLALVISLVGSTAQALVVFDNNNIRSTDGGPIIVKHTDGYQFGDEIVLSPATSAYITNFTFEYFGTNLSGASAVFRIYANNGTNYGTNFMVPGDLLYDSGSFSISDGSVDGFGSLNFNQLNTPGFGVAVPSNFTWTVEFSGVGAGKAGLAVYDAANAPSVGVDYGAYWEQNLTTKEWFYKSSPTTNYNFGAVVEAQALGVDTVPPALSISGPADKFRTDPSAPTGVLAVTGTAKDPGGPVFVYYNLNSSGFRPASMTSGLMGSSNWTANLDLKVGANRFAVKALDRSGNVKTLPARTFTFVVTNQCTFTFAAGAGSGTTKGVVAIPITSASASANLEIGATYALEVVQNVDPLTKLVTHFYSNTVLSSVVGTTNLISSKFTFVMRTNTSLLINCLTNRFTAIAGNYNGLIGADATNQTSSGFVSLKVDGQRNFSGKMLVAGETLGVSGRFDLSGNCNNVGSVVSSGASKIIISKKQVLTNSIRLSMNFGVNPTIEGTLSNSFSGAVTSILADKDSWSDANPATNYSGTYTMVIPPSLTGLIGPSGYSHASVIINTNGLVTMTGLTADGQKLAQKVKLSQQGNWPLFAANSIDTLSVSPINGLPNKLSKGSVIGWLSVVPNASSEVYRLGGELKWIRTANASATYYPAGFTNISEPLACKYVCNVNPSTLKFTNAVVGLPGLVGYLKISGAGLSSTNLAVTETTNATMTVNRILPGKQAPMSASISQVAKFGNVNGSFITTLPATKFYGIALQAEGRAYGFFNNSATSQSGSIVVENP